MNFGKKCENLWFSLFLVWTNKNPKYGCKMIVQTNSADLCKIFNLSIKNWKSYGHSVQRSLEMCENKEKRSVSEDFRQKKFHQWRNLRKKLCFRFELLHVWKSYVKYVVSFYVMWISTLLESHVRAPPVQRWRCTILNKIITAATAVKLHGKSV